MLDMSALNGRLDYETAVVQLIRANFTKRDSHTGKALEVLTPKEIADYRGQINEEEITQGYLWLSATLSPAKQVIQYAVVDTQQVSGSPVTPVNRLLTMQDSFLISNMFYGVGIYQFTDGTLSNPDFTGGNNWSPVTFNSPWDNNGLGVDWDPGTAMLWIGAYLQLTINKKVVIPYWDCYQHFKIPQTQSTPGFPVPSAYIPNQKNQIDGSTDGFSVVQPNIVIGGGRNNDLKLNLAANIPANIAPFDGSGYNVTYIAQTIVVMRGILMQNSTTVK